MLMLMLACAGADLPPGADPLPGGWIATVLEAPEALDALLAEGPREGWIALHANDLPAAAALGGPPAVRASQELAAVRADLDRLSGLVWERTFATWEARAGLPPQSAIPVVAALSAYHHGEDARAEAWLGKLDPDAPPELHLIAGQLRDGGLGAVTGETAIGRCVVARRTGGGCPAPLHTEGARDLYDPLAFGAAAEAPEQAVDGLGGVVFSGRWSADVAARPVLPDAWRPGEDDAPEDARERVRAADDALAAWVALQEARAPGGLALLGELALVEGYRSKALAAAMRHHLDAGQPRSAQALGLMALDAGAGRAVGATNPPALFVMLATADLMMGRSREALDMLAPLRGPDYPAVDGLRETLNDLVVLEGMGSVGDSKEN